MCASVENIKSGCEERCQRPGKIGNKRLWLTFNIVKHEIQYKNLIVRFNNNSIEKHKQTVIQ